LWVCKLGYRIVGAGKRMRVVQPVRDERGESPMRAVTRLPAGTFRDFGSLPRTEKAIVRFANEHGLLGVTTGIDKDVQVRLRLDAWGTEGEPVTDWYRFASDMSEAVDLWDAVSEPEALKALVVYEGGRYFYRGDPFLQKWKSYDEGTRSRMLQLSSRPWTQDRREVALMYLEWFVNSYMGFGAASLTFDLDEDGQPHLVERSRVLLLALWLQFALAICSEYPEHVDYPGTPCQALGCNERFTARSMKARYCSSACRQAEYRRRIRSSHARD
jgi:hypothetical protein